MTREQKKYIAQETKDYVFITLGLILYSFGFTFFLMPYEIVTGGVAGIAAIVEYASSFPNQYTYFLVNFALLVMALRILGIRFLIKTIYAILMLTFLLALMKELRDEHTGADDDEVDEDQHRAQRHVVELVH